MIANQRRTGKASALDAAYNERGLMRPNLAQRILGCSPDFITHLVNQEKLAEVAFDRNGHTYKGYPTARVQEIADRLAAGTPRARL